MNVEDEVEEQIVIEEEHSQNQQLHGTPRGQRGRKRVALSPPETPLHRRRSTARDVLPIDDEVNQYFPCPVAQCDAVYQNRSERGFHIRTDHTGYKYKDGDGVEKVRHLNSVQVEHHLEQPCNIVEQTDQGNMVAFEAKPLVISSANDLNITSNYHEDQQPLPMGLGDNKEDSWKHIGGDLKEEPDSQYDELEQDDNDHDFSPQCSSDMTGDRNVGDDELFRKNVLLGPRRRGRPRSAPGQEPAANSKIRIPDPNGKYRCYIPECPWRGGYRSIRAEHMKWCHKEWKQPPRYILQRLSQGDPAEFWDSDKNGELTCFIEGCSWRGIYRASRSAHMRSAHPEYQPLKKKAPMGGYIVDGKYECHDPNCGWRGGSRSTRAAHMRREHPGFMNPMYQPRMLMCTDCNAQCMTHKTFVDHLVSVHHIGGTVQREFNDIRDYEEWYEAVQDSFSVDFIKKMGVKQTESYQVLYLYCSRSNGCRPKKVKADPYIPMYSKTRNLTRPFRTRNHCAAFLRVVHWNDGKLTVVGCVEHTGHRLGTALLRLSQPERELLDEYLYVHDDETLLECMLDRLRESEGYAIDGFDASLRTAEEMSSFVLNTQDPLLSLKMLFESDMLPPSSFFNVNIPMGTEDHCFTFGIMTEEMKTLWKESGRRAVCLEEVRLVINNWEVSLIFVLVFDESCTPRCCCLYISQESDRIAVLRQLHNVDPRPMETLVTDGVPDWLDMLEQVYGEAAYNVDLQIAEWHLLPVWAQQLDQMVPNRVDRFTILCCLRRWLRATDPSLFEAMIIDMFDAFRELEVDHLSQAIDSQLNDPEYSKRWSPLNRNELTEHANPTLEIACRMFREKFLNCDMCTRIDEYVGLLVQRLAEFNSCTVSDLYSTGSVEPPRQIPQLDDGIDPNSVLADGTLIVQQPHTSTMIVASDVNGQPILIDEKSHLITVSEVEELEEVEEEEVIMDMEELQDVTMDMPSTSSMASVMGGKNNNQENSDERKERLNAMMEAIKTKMNSLTGERDIELLENQLAHVVEQLDGCTDSGPMEKSNM